MKPGVLDIKSKLLILLAVDAYAGSSGVKNIAAAAKNAGATNEEIIESVKVAYGVGGNRILHIAESVFD